MIRFITFYILMLGASLVFAQDKPAYKLFDGSGKETRYDKMLTALAKADVVFFGELHNDPISHWLELHILRSLYEKDASLVLAMEMFEADDQVVLNEYLSGLIEEQHLLKEAKIWTNYKTDYKPLVEFARQHKVPVIASNIPRRYANLVYRKGLQALDSLPDGKQWIAPLPITVDLELPGYKNMIAMMGGHSARGTAENMAVSQAVKDATMAHFILRNKTGKVYHVNGSYHSQNGEGIIWYLKQAQPALKIAAIQVVEQDSIESIEPANKDLADFIICVPKDMTKTY